jgi:adenosylmethionine-8-amino-7-oxononanoate aminotransferase
MRITDHSFFARNLDHDYPVCVKGEGVWLWDENGKKYLDGCSGANVSSIGHGVKEIGEAMKKQSDMVAYVPPQHFLNKPTIELCKRLLEYAPDTYKRVMLCSGGSEANENALKIARQYHVYRGNASKYMTISRWQGFHGNTIVADAVGGTTSRRKISAPMLMEVDHIPPANCFRCVYEHEHPSCNLLCAKALENSILQLGPENISSFICEPIVGSASAAATPVKEYFPMIREICDRYDVLWIDDEIMAGSGRTGKFLAIEHWDVLPDIVVMAKGLSCGYAPLAAILLTEKVWKPFYENKFPYIGGHTYNAHPVTASVGLAVLDYIDQHHVYENVECKGGLLREGLKKLQKKHAIIGDVRGMGLFLGIEFVKNPLTHEPFEPSLNVTPRMLNKAMDKGLIVYASRGCVDGRSGDGLLICPPLVVNEEEIQFILEVLDVTISEIVSELQAEGEYDY